MTTPDTRIYRVDFQWLRGGTLFGPIVVEADSMTALAKHILAAIRDRNLTTPVEVEVNAETHKIRIFQGLHRQAGEGSFLIVNRTTQGDMPL